LNKKDKNLESRKRIEKELNLKESEEKYRTIFENTGTATVIIEKDTTISLANEKFEELSGYSKEEIEWKKKWTEFVIKEDLEMMKKYHYSRRKTSDIAPKSYEFHFINKRGDIRNILITIDMIPRTKKSVASLLDITERKKAEENIKEYARKMEVLNRIIITVNKIKDLSLLLENVLNLTLELMNFEGGGIYLVDESTRIAELACFKGLPSDFIKDVKRVKIDEGAYNIVFNEGQPLITDDYSKIHPRRSKKWGILSLASIPFFVKNKVYGAINIASKNHHFFSNEEKNIFQTIAQETGAIIEKMQTEEALQENQANLQTLFDSMQELIFVMNFDGRFLSVNPSVLKTLNYSEEEMLKMNILKIYSPAQHDRALRIFRDLVEGKINSCNIPLITKEEKIIPVETIFTKGRWDDQDVLFGISRDITERLLAERKIKESEEKYRNILENIQEGYFELDLKGTYTFVNKYHSNYYGVPKDEMIGKYYADFVDQKHKEMLFKIFNQVYREEVPSATFEVEATRYDGVKRVYEGTCNIKLDSNGKKIGFYSLTRDITERKNWEQKLRESEEKYRHLFESSPYSIGLLDLKGNFIDCNTATNHFLSMRTKDDLIGRNFREIFSLNERNKPLIPLFEKQFKQALRGEATESFEFPLYRSIGGMIWINLHGSLIKIEDQSLIQYIIQDITERKKAEQKLKESEENYREAYNRVNFYKDLFTHDMNNILQNILSSIEIATHYLGEEIILPEVRRMFNNTKQQVRRGATLISNIQKLSDLDKAQILTQHIEVCKVLKESVEILKKNFPKRKINVEIETEKKKLFAKANDLLIDVFENILINAVKYNERSIVEILIKFSKIKKEGSKCLKMEFIDNGYGISNDQKEIIFERAHRADKSTSGMGLGLSLVKKIISLYNGEIWVEDKIQGDYSKGSNFIIIIPEV